MNMIGDWLVWILLIQHLCNFGQNNTDDQSGNSRDKISNSTYVRSSNQIALNSNFCSKLLLQTPGTASAGTRLFSSGPSTSNTSKRKSKRC